MPGRLLCGKFGHQLGCRQGKAGQGRAGRQSFGGVRGGDGEYLKVGTSAVGSRGEKEMAGSYVHVVVQDEELLAVVLHDVLAQVADEVSNGHGLAMVVASGNR